MKESDNREIGAINIIAQGTQLEGSILTNGDCRIDGVVKGNVTSKAKIIIGRSGKVDGNVTCANIDIEGTINAETLNVTELIFLKETANVVGNISANKIAIEPGAEFSGNCKMHNQRAAAPAAQPQPEKR
ncbi:MAG: polymer-forming cytoskeletal protein [Bacteroidales bacterium]|nr:polymer-forming cytoskeletal protein [Bacteroidales bacterium]